MAITSGILGCGTILSYGDLEAASSTWTTVGQVKNVSGLMISVNGVEITNNDSPSCFKEQIPGIRSVDDASCDMVYLKGVVTALSAFAIAGTKRQWKVTLPDTSTWICNGFISKFGTTEDHGTEIKGSLTISFTGLPAWNPAA